MTRVKLITIGRQWGINTAVYYAAFITIGLSSAVLGPTLPALAANTGTILSEIGFLFTARSLGMMIGALLGARLIDHWSGHRLMAGMIAGLALALALTPLMTRIVVLTAVLLFAGLAESLIDIGGNTLLVWIHRDKVGPYMNGLHFFFGVGAFLSPIIVAQTLLHTEGIQWAYWLPALIILPVALVVVRQPSPTAVAQPTNEQSNQQSNPLLISLIMAFFFLYVGAEIGFGGWVFSYAVSTAVINKATAAYLTSAFWGALTVGRLLAIPIARSLRPRTVLLLDLLGALASIGVLLLWPAEAAAIWVGSIGLGFSFAAIFPTMLSLAGRRLPITGRVTGWFFVGASLGGMTLPWFMGYLLETIAPTAVLWAILLTLLLAAGLLLLIVYQDQ